jgi:hypothetical protein
MNRVWDTSSTHVLLLSPLSLILWVNSAASPHSHALSQLNYTYADRKSFQNGKYFSIHTHGSYCTCTCIWFACAAVREKEQTAVWLLPPASLSIMSCNVRETIGQWRAEQKYALTHVNFKQDALFLSPALLHCIYLHFTRTPAACSYLSWVGLNLYNFLLRLHVCWPTERWLACLWMWQLLKHWSGKSLPFVGSKSDR